MTGRCSLLAILVALALAGILHAQTIPAPSKGAPAVDKGIYDFWLNDIDGKPVQLSAFKGKVLLIVNTASECGFTPQYEPLEKLYQEYREKGFAVLAFPSNDFGAQEPGTNAEIRAFCSANYRTTFPLFAKITVKGSAQHPLYAYLTRASHFPGEVKWNFQKYLIDRSGRVAARYGSAVDPMSKDVRGDVERELAKKTE